MKKFSTLNTAIVAFSLALAAPTGVQGQTFTPIDVTPGSFTQSIVVPTNWTYKLNAQSVTVTIDHGPSLQTNTVTGFPTYYSLLSGDTFFEKGLARSNATAFTWGLPAGGTLLTNVSLGASHYYRLPYWTNYNSNCLCICPYTNGGTYNNLPLSGGPYIGQSYYNVSLGLTNTTPCTALSFLCTGGGPFSNTVTIAYADGTTQGPVSFAIPNWFVNAATYTMAGGTTPTCSYAYTAQARCNPAENQNNFNISTGVTSGSRLWTVDIALNNATSYPTNLTFNPSYANNAAGTVAAEVIIAVSGSTNPGDNQTLPNTTPLTGPFTPMGVTGFNAGFVVANSTNSLAGLAPLTATMDNGTNLAGGANTWFEQGWDLAAPSNGFPAHGSILTSAAFTNRTYQMPASYNQPMSVLIDHNHTIANITPLNTNLSYTAFSLLTAGASIGSGKQMTNFIILQHVDGINETNIFIGYDWFETTVPPAYSANERVNVGTSTSLTGREVNNLDTSSPHLFDSEFPMSDATPVSNIIVGFYQAPAANATTYVIAVSATTNFVPPVTPLVYTPAQNVFPGQTAVYSITPIGTLPTYQWQVSDGATFTNSLHDGATGTGSVISGSTTTNLTIANVSAADSNYYTCFISNPAGSTNSTLAPLTLRQSTLSPIVAPGDTITDFYGGGYTPGEAYPSPVGLTLGNAIDGTTAAYLNYGDSGGNTAFQGPIGLIVSPSAGSSIVSALRFIVAVNAPICDPADFSLEGSNDGTNWTTVVADMPLSLPNVRNLSSSSPVNVTNQVLQEVDFANTTSYVSYRLTIQNVKNNVPGLTANSMQIGEIQFLGTLGQLPPGIVKQPAPANQLLLPGGSMTWSLLADGPTPLTYQWYQGSTANPIAGATTNTLTVAGVSASTAGFFCIVSNAYGTTTSTSVGYTVLPSLTNNYVATIVGDAPLAFLRLDEGPDDGAGNNGTIAYDIFGGHDGVYSNTVLRATPPGTYSTSDPSEAFAEFGLVSDSTANYSNIDNYVGLISGINFGTGTNAVNTNFSVEAWVNLYSNNLNGAGIVSQGPGGAESWAMDMGGTGNAFRFYFRNATNAASVTVSPNVAPSTNAWYHVVGVLNETSNYESIYINGVLAATAVVGTNVGVHSTNVPIVIGSRRASGATNYNNQLDGVVANVAIYPYALTSTQVSNHFNATAQPPEIFRQPLTLTEYLEIGGSATMSIVAVGPQPISYQWFFAEGGVTNAIISATNASFTLTNAAVTNAGSYFCTASNPFGATNSESVVMTILTASSSYVSTILADGPIAFFRLDEHPDNGTGNDGTVAYDIVGGHNGFYTNVILAPPYIPGYSVSDPDVNSTQFGSIQDNSITTTHTGSSYTDNYVGGISGISFAAPTNSSTNFSVEAWVYLESDTLAGAGIVAAGTGNGGEEFALDTGGTGNAFRFYYRNAGGGSVGVSPNVAPVVGTWYHVVGVVNQSNNVVYQYIYTNGLLGASVITTYANPPGVLAPNLPISLGARTSAAVTNYNLQLNGALANVAIYPYALSSNQVINHYLSSGIAPVFTLVPTNTAVAQGQVAVFHGNAVGSTNLTYQWSINGTTLTDGPLPVPGSSAYVFGTATGNLTVSNVTVAADNGETFYLMVTNKYGSTPQVSATLTVTASPTLASADLQTNYTAVDGFSFSLSALFTGSSPLNYQWLHNGSPLSNGPRISGATSNMLTINPVAPGDAGTYQLTASNTFGTNGTSVAQVTVAPVVTFNGFGSSWSLNGSAEGGFISSNVLELTDGLGSEARSSFFASPVYVGAFQVSYTYTDVNGRGYTADADGACFVIQNDARGAAAIGGDGGQLGYGTPNPITNSVGLEINLFQGFGIYFAANGAIVSTPEFDSDLLFASGHPMNITVTYLGGVATVQAMDTVTSGSFTMSTNVNIPAIVGGTNLAYIGFTGGDGGTTSTQQISNFEYIGLVDLTAVVTGGNLVLSWPAFTAEYQLQSTPSLTSPNWSNVNNTVTVTNNQNQVTVPLSGSGAFYRLVLQ